MLLIGQRAAVQLKIQFAVIHGQVAAARLQLLHKAAHGIIRNFGAALQIGETARCLDHLKLRPAAAISITEGDEAPVGSLFVAHAVTVADAVHALKEAGRVGPCVDYKKVREHLRAVDARPLKGVVGKIVCVIPGQLCRKEIFHAEPAHDLWDGGGIAEGVREPEGVGQVSETALRVELSP